MAVNRVQIYSASLLGKEIFFHNQITKMKSLIILNLVCVCRKRHATFIAGGSIRLYKSGGQFGNMVQSLKFFIYLIQ